MSNDSQTSPSVDFLVASLTAVESQVQSITEQLTKIKETLGEIKQSLSQEKEKGQQNEKEWRETLDQQWTQKWSQREQHWGTLVSSLQQLLGGFNVEPELPDTPEKLESPLASITDIADVFPDAGGGSESSPTEEQAFAEDDFELTSEPETFTSGAASEEFEF